jgi:hypothetical protein
MIYSRRGLMALGVLEVLTEIELAPLVLEVASVIEIVLLGL